VSVVAGEELKVRKEVWGQVGSANAVEPCVSVGTLQVGAVSELGVGGQVPEDFSSHSAWMSGVGPLGVDGLSPVEADLGQQAADAFGPAAGRQLLDLNVACCLADGAQPNVLPPTAVLGEADGRLNREVKERVGQKSGVKGTARFVAPLKKSLLCNPPPRAKAHHGKTNAGAEQGPGDEKRKSYGASKGPGELSLDDQATKLLLKATRASSEVDCSAVSAAKLLGDVLAQPLQHNTVMNVRSTLGLPELDASDNLGALICEVGMVTMFEESLLLRWMGCLGAFPMGTCICTFSFFVCDGLCLVLVDCGRRKLGGLSCSVLLGSLSDCVCLVGAAFGGAWGYKAGGVFAPIYPW
jgi:hypothetical protein